MPIPQTLLVLAAMREEEAAIHRALTSFPYDENVLGRSLKVPIRSYRLGQRTLLLAQSGMGPVNAALTLACIAESQCLDGVILLGVGGALVDGLKIGDLVISKRVLQHDSFSSLDFGNPRMRPGHLILNEDEAQAHVASYESDPHLVALLAKGRHAKAGTVVSGNEFVGTVKRKRDLAALDPDALLVDMEAAGVAQVATRLGLPFVVAKTVADRLNVDGTIESDFRACLDGAAANASEVLLDLWNNGS